MIRCSWTDPRREDLLADAEVVLEEGPTRALRFRLVCSSDASLVDLAQEVAGEIRLHPDGRRWCVEVDWGGSGARAVWDRSALHGLARGGRRSRSHLRTTPPSGVELADLGWAIVTTERPGLPRARELVMAPGGRELLGEFLDSPVPEGVDELYLRVLRVVVRDGNDSAPACPAASRRVAVVLPWDWDGHQVHVERVAMATHYQLAAVEAEQVFATLTPFSLQVFSYTALHSTSPVLQTVARSCTRWSFVQPVRSRREDWARAASLNFRSIQESRDLFSAFESPAFSLLKDEAPVRAVVAQSTMLVVLEEPGACTAAAVRLAAGAPVREIPRRCYL